MSGVSCLPYQLKWTEIVVSIFFSFVVGGFVHRGASKESRKLSLYWQKLGQPMHPSFLNSLLFTYFINVEKKTMKTNVDC